ncbi:MAG: coenzyme F420-0:L-glutamate ligase [Chloroflexi bacterium]|nr:coenzyme F420-0:L-glutamate ligase [Chloroflexota bacterium]
MTPEVRIIGINGLPEVTPGSDLAGLLAEAARAQGTPLQEGDVVVITQKVVSKTEGRLVDLSTITPSPLAERWAAEQGRPASLIELALRESRRVSRMDRGVLLTETHHGFYCVNAGVDTSNVPGDGMATLLPQDPDGSARTVRKGLRKATGHDVAVIITDSWGRPWREGITNFAIGAAGIGVLRDYRGMEDPYGHELHASVVAVVDELASAAELVMGKLDRVPAAIVRGYEYSSTTGTMQDLVRPAEQDLYR